MAVKTRKVLDVTEISTGTVTRMTYMKFYNRFGNRGSYSRYTARVQSILRGEDKHFRVVEVEEVVPDKNALKAAALQTPIARAVAPLKKQAVERANDAAREMVARAAAELKAGGDDLQLVAPYPKSNLSRAVYRQQLAKYKFFSRITTSRKSSRSMHEPDYRDMNPEAVEHFVKEARENAAFEFEAYVCKLTAKIGPVSEAKLEGTHVWSYSFLNVIKANGERESWKTQTILNQSVYGKVFNQFPTRKVVTHG